MTDAWNGSWGTSWGTSWTSGGTPPVVVTPTKDSGAGRGKKWKIIPLDEWLQLHHPEESVQEQIEAVAEISEAIEDAPAPVVRQVYRELLTESRRVGNLVSELKTQSQRVDRLAGFLEEMAEYKAVLERTKRKIRTLERSIREMDDEEALMIILHHV